MAHCPDPPVVEVQLTFGDLHDCPFMDGNDDHCQHIYCSPKMGYTSYSKIAAP